MEKERRIKTLSVVALIIAVLGLTIAFAALSTTLTINGNASVDSASWDIHFENISLTEKTGSAEGNLPTLTGTSINNFDVKLTKPGDKVVYEFDIVNEGSIDAILSNIAYSTFPNGIYLESDISKCTGKNNVECMKYDFNKDGAISTSDLAKLYSFLGPRLYIEDEVIEEYWYDEDDNIEYGFWIGAHQTKHVKFVLEFSEKADFVLDEPIVIFNSQNTAMQLNFTQK